MTSPRPVVAAFLAFRFCRSLYFHIAILVPFFLSKGLDLSDVFLLESVYFFAKVLFDVPSGLIADRLNKRLCIASSGFLASGGYCLVATGSSFEIFLLAQIILGISVALFSGADTTAMLDQIQRSDRQHLYSRVESWGGALRHLGFGTAAIIGGFVAVYWAPSITWGLSSIAMFTAGCIGLTFPQNPPGKTEAGQLGNVDRRDTSISAPRQVRVRCHGSVCRYLLTCPPGTVFHAANCRPVGGGSFRERVAVCRCYRAFHIYEHQVRKIISNLTPSACGVDSRALWRHLSCGLGSCRVCQHTAAGVGHVCCRLCHLRRAAGTVRTTTTHLDCTAHTIGV